MFRGFDFKDVRSSTFRAAWQIEGVPAQGAALDFVRQKPRPPSAESHGE
jgi:hypothetical protein